MRAAKTWGSIASVESDIDSDSRPFSMVVLRQAKRVKYKRIGSPIDNDAVLAKRSTGPVTAGQLLVPSINVQRGGSSQAVTGRGNKIVGMAKCSTLKAAEPNIKTPSEKSVFCVSNVASNFTVKDIKDHCKSLDVPVLFCFDISNPELSAKAFKLAVRSSDKHVITDSEVWPERVIVRPWTVSNRTARGGGVVEESTRSKGRVGFQQSFEIRN